MARLRSIATDTVGTALLVIGFVGFAVCWQIGWTAQERILTTDRFDRPTAATPSAIEMKGQTYFVEPSYARRFRLANNLIFPFWGVAAVGMGLRQRKKIGEWWKRRRLHADGIGSSSIHPREPEAPVRDKWSIVPLGVVACVALYGIWGVVPALVCAAALILGLICARLFKRT